MESTRAYQSSYGNNRNHVHPYSDSREFGTRLGQYDSIRRGQLTQQHREGNDQCIANDLNTGQAYVALKCIIKHDLRAQMCTDLRTGAAPINASKDAFDVLCNGIS
jgi:hypothetical protein